MACAQHTTPAPDILSLSLSLFHSAYPFVYTEFTRWKSHNCDLIFEWDKVWRWGWCRCEGEWYNLNKRVDILWFCIRSVRISHFTHSCHPPTPSVRLFNLWDITWKRNVSIVSSMTRKSPSGWINIIILI